MWGIARVVMGAVANGRPSRERRRRAIRLSPAGQARCGWNWQTHRRQMAVRGNPRGRSNRPSATIRSRSPIGRGRRLKPGPVLVRIQPGAPCGCGGIGRHTSMRGWRAIWLVRVRVAPSAPRMRQPGRKRASAVCNTAAIRLRGCKSLLAHHVPMQTSTCEILHVAVLRAILSGL